MTADAFADAVSAAAPLAERMRPRTLDEVVGQQHLLAAGAPLRVALQAGRIPSMVFWGPARRRQDHPGAAHRRPFGGAVPDPVGGDGRGQGHPRGDGRRARAALQANPPRRTVLFVDEIHRFNKGQQDALLPYVEDGTVVLVGATTENPSFELNGALLSRLRVFVLRSLDEEAILGLLRRALTDAERGLGAAADALPEAWLARIAESADGDARRALILLETAYELSRAQRSQDGGENSDELLEKLIGRGLRRFDKGGENFYDQISALHKSVRGSDPDGALYWFARMLDGGVDPVYVARRVLRMSIEDIGLADPRAQRICLDAWDTWERLGSPEGELALAVAVVYLAVAAKSNAVYSAYGAVRETVASQGTLEVPMHLRNAPTKLMKGMGYGQGYRYDHAEEGAHAAGQQYLPDALAGTEFYQPTSRGLEAKIADKLAQLRAANRKP